MRSLHPWPIFPSNLEPPVARSLSIQFILQTLIDSFEVLSQIQNKAKEQLKGGNLKEEITLFGKEIEKLFLFSLANPFSQKPSVLDKLCFYCEILLQASLTADSEIPMILEEMRAPIINIKSKINFWKKSPSSLEQMQLCIDDLFENLGQKLCIFFSAFSRYLKVARSDENVLVFLIENKEKLNEFLGSRRIENLLQSFFPAGHMQLRAAIHEGYSRRGFTTFLSKIEPLIDAIEWETPSCPTQTH